MASGAGGDGTASNTDIPRGLINRTGNPIGSSSRLPSVRTNRDLTLGGVQKKVFKPNLAAVKKASSKEELSKQSIPASSPSTSEKREDGKSRDGGKSDRGKGRGRGRGNFEDRTIQLQSEFAYGPTGKAQTGWSRGSGGSGGGGGRGGGGGGGGRDSETDSVAVRSAMKPSRELEDDKKLLNSILRDDFISDLASGDPNMAPIRLPLSINRGGVKMEPKPEIKEEVMDVDEVDAKVETKPALGHISFSQLQMTDYTTSIKDIFDNSMKSENGELIFLQFPDTLPGLPASALTDDRPKTSTNNTAGTKEDELVDRLSSCQLKDCSEGYMGKLRIYKSGKAQLVLGDNIMDVLPGIPVNFHQELVSIHTDDSPGQMIVLGPVSHKLMVTPDYNDLLSHVNKFS